MIGMVWNNGILIPSQNSFTFNEVVSSGNWMVKETKYTEKNVDFHWKFQ